MKKEPVDTDGERDLTMLLAKHADAVSELRELCGQLIASAQGDPELLAAHHNFDDIFLLRYVLSFGKPHLAKPAVEASLEFRRNNWHWIKSASLGKGMDECPHLADLTGAIGVAALLDGVRSKSEDEFLYLIRSGAANTKAVMRLKTVDQVADFLSYSNEHLFQICENDARQRHRLTKIVNVNDLTGANLLNFDRRFGAALGQSSHRSEFLHPQLIHKPVMFNPPGLFKSLYSFMKLVLSKSMTEKMGVCVCPKGPEKGDISRCPFVRLTFHVRDIPSYLGGDLVLPNNSILNQ